MAEPALNDFSGTVLILYGDVPLVQTNTMQRLCAAVDKDHGLAVLGFRPGADTRSYGRLITDANSGLEQIVEHVDATPQQRAIRFCNSGIMAVRAELLWTLLAMVHNESHGVFSFWYRSLRIIGLLSPIRCVARLYCLATW